MPAVDAAVASLSTLTKKDITEIKHLAKPPAALERVAVALCHLLGLKPDFASFKKFAGEIDFLDRLLSFDKDNIPPKKLSIITNMCNDPQMTVEAVKKVSSAAAG